MRRINFIIKRIFDFCASLVAVIILSPLLLIVSILIRIDSPGPEIYKQIRLGRDKKEFVAYKFRTMYKDSSINNLKAPKEDDPRVTRIGSFLRKTSIDELPQLFNVLNGTMSIIGPRAVPARELELRIQNMLIEEPGEGKEAMYREYMDKRQMVKPGITGMAQAYGRSSLTAVKATELDVYYVENFSVLLDIKIFIKTVVTVLKREGVN